MSALHFFERSFPSANSVLLLGERPILIDSGFGSDAEETRDWLLAQGVELGRLRLLNSHHHSDHVGGNHLLQRRHGARILAHRWEGGLVNRRDPLACAAAWIGGAVMPYRVDGFLAPGETLETGRARLRVLHTPGHTLGHLSFYLPDERALVLGDLAHRDDVGWLNPFREGAAAAQLALESLEQVLGLGARVAYSGHGPALLEPEASLRAAQARYRRWLAEPERLAWHACKRLFGNALMLAGGLPEAEVEPFLLGRPWFGDYARSYFGDPPAFVEPLVAEMLRSGAAAFEAGRLIARTPHRRPAPGWATAPGNPQAWPPLEEGA